MRQDPLAWSVLQEQHFSQERPHISADVDLRLFDSFVPGAHAILDVGCNGGHVVRRLCQMGKVAYGVDLEGVLAQTDCCWMGHRVLRPCNLECDPLPLPNGVWRFDLVLALGVLEHLVTYDAFLPKVRAVLAPRGIVVLTTCNRRAIPTEPHHYQHFTVEELVQLGVAAGLETLTVTRLGVNDTGLKIVYRGVEQCV